MDAHQADATTKSDTIVLGMGCFWGAEKRMAGLVGVIDAESGYANGEVAGNYEAVLTHERALRFGLSRKRNHAEVVKVTYDPTRVDLETLLIHFWESHDPTQGDRQGNDIGSNYRSAIYTNSEMQRAIALKTRDVYQRALTRAGLGRITTEISPLTAYYRAEDYHQDYLWKNPDGYCGLGGTGIPYPRTATQSPTDEPPRKALDAAMLDSDLQLIVFEAAECTSCRRFATEIVDRWESDVPVARTLGKDVPTGWKLKHPILASPTTVLFKQCNEVGRFTGYDGDKQGFWQWLGSLLLTPEQYEIAFSHGTECAFTGPHLKEKRPGRFVDPLTGATLFRTDAKFESGTGWPSFFRPEEGAVTLHEDNSYGMRRIEVRSASSGIHLGHVFDDGPSPTLKRYCINGKVLRFVPDNA